MSCSCDELISLVQIAFSKEIDRAILLSNRPHPPQEVKQYYTSAASGIEELVKSQGEDYTWSQEEVDAILASIPTTIRTIFHSFL